MGGEAILDGMDTTSQPASVHDGQSFAFLERRGRLCRVAHLGVIVRQSDEHGRVA